MTPSRCHLYCKYNCFFNFWVQCDAWPFGAFGGGWGPTQGGSGRHGATRGSSGGAKEAFGGPFGGPWGALGGALGGHGRVFGELWG